MLDLNHLKRNPRIPPNFNFSEFNITLESLDKLNSTLRSPKLKLSSTHNQIMLEGPSYLVEDTNFVDRVLYFLGNMDIDVAHYSLEIYDHPTDTSYKAYVLTIHSIYA